MNSDRQQIVEKLAEFQCSPYEYTMWAYPWGEKNTVLEDEEGPDTWQKETMDYLGKSYKDVLTGVKKGAVRLAVRSGHGIGKALSLETQVDTPVGRRQWGDLQVGDSLFGSDGSRINIVTRYDHLDVEMYCVTFDDGSSVDCCVDHLWTVKGRNDRRTAAGWQTLSTGEILKKGVKRPNGASICRQWEIPTIKPVKYPHKDLIIHPYALGVWLGDGCRNSSMIASDDIEVIDRLKDVGEKVTKQAAKFAYNISKLHSKLRKLGIADRYSYQKSIPVIYMENSVDVRSEVLRGLLDTDGEANKQGSIIFSSTSLALVEDVIWLARSLGGKARLQPTAKRSFFNGVEHRLCYRTTLTMPDGFKSFYIKRKQERVGNVQKRYLTRWIDSIKPIGRAPAMCVTVDASDSLYLANEFIVTHNTAQVAFIIRHFIACFPNPQIIVTANTKNQLEGKTWRELAKWDNLSLDKSFFKWTATRYTCLESPETWFAQAIPWSSEKPEAFAGTHEKFVLIIFDEASGIDHAIWKVVEGALTDAKGIAVLIAFGNPTRNSGSFFECFNKFRHRWHAIRVNSWEAKQTSKDQLQEWKEDYGEDSNFYKIRVLGEFPDQSDMQFINSESVNICMQYKAAGYEIFPVIVSVDVARFGDDRTVIIIRQGRKIWEPVTYKGIDTMKTVDETIKIADLYKADHIVVDEGGVGGGVVDRLRQLGRPVKGCNAGSSPNDDIKYKNLRAEMWDKMRQAIYAGIEMPKSDELKADLTSIEYDYDDKQKLMLEKKKDMKKRGVASPDIGDALAMTYAFKFNEKQDRLNTRMAPRIARGVTKLWDW